MIIFIFQVYFAISILIIEIILLSAFINTMHRCLKVATSKVFVDTGIEGAEHLNQAALAWNALLSPAVADWKYTRVFLCTPDSRRAGLLRSNLIYLSFFWQQEEWFLKQVNCYMRILVPLEDKMRSLAIVELEDVLIGGLSNLQHPTLQSVFVGLFLCSEATQTKLVIVTLILCIY